MATSPEIAVDRSGNAIAAWDGSGGCRLAPGRYRLVVSAAQPGSKRSAPARAAFQVVRNSHERR